MITYELMLELKSSSLAGSGVGFGSEIDTDVVFDETGLPYIPAKRIKGCLRDAAEEVLDMFGSAGIAKERIQVGKTFGNIGSGQSAPVYFSNLYTENHEQARTWLRYFMESTRFNYLITPDRVLDTFTEVRQQTRISESGVAFDHSLRTIRVLRKGLIFRGEVRMEGNDDQVLNTLLLACCNFRRFGTRRNRGFGEVHCTLCDTNGRPVLTDKKLEELCTA